MCNFLKSIIFFRDSSCGVIPSTELGEIELLLPNLNFGTTKRVSSLSQGFRGILILSEIGEVTVSVDTLSANSDTLLIDLSAVEVLGSGAKVSTGSVLAAVGNDWPPKIFGKLNFFL